MDKEYFIDVLQSALFYYWDGLTFEKIKALTNYEDRVIMAGIELANYLKGIEIKKIV